MLEPNKPASNVASLIISGKIPLTSPVSPNSRPAQEGSSETPETIRAYIFAYYYAALANVLCHAYLLPADQPPQSDLLKAITDASYRHFHMLDAWFAALDPDQLLNIPNSQLFLEARDVWKPWVADWSTVLKRDQSLMSSQSPTRNEFTR
jgi:hypothetical protein